MRAAALALLCWPALAAGQDVVVIGEIHDNPRHHLNQARIVAELPRHFETHNIHRVPGYKTGSFYASESTFCVKS